MIYIYFLILSHVRAITYIETYFKQYFEIKYDIPGSYILTPRDYKFAPTIFVSINGAGGGTDLSYQSFRGGGCTGQNGGYLTVLLDTRSGTTLFNIITGRKGVGGGQNITGCGPYNKPIFNTISPTSGGDSLITSQNEKIWAIAKGGTYAESQGDGGDPPRFVSCRKFEAEKGGYLNVSFGYGIVSLERQNGEDSYFQTYFYRTLEKPGYGGRGLSTFNASFYPCAINYSLGRGGSGSNGLVRVIPVAVPINILLTSIDIDDVDINFYVH
jgi:hypothetical protein